MQLEDKLSSTQQLNIENCNGLYVKLNTDVLKSPNNIIRITTTTDKSNYFGVEGQKANIGLKDSASPLYKKPLFVKKYTEKTSSKYSSSNNSPLKAERRKRTHGMRTTSSAIKTPINQIIKKPVIKVHSPTTSVKKKARSRPLALSPTPKQLPLEASKYNISTPYLGHHRSNQSFFMSMCELIQFH